MRFIVVLRDEDVSSRLESIEIVRSISYNPIIFIIKNKTGSFQPLYKPRLAYHFETLDLDNKESLKLFMSEGLKVEFSKSVKILKVPLQNI